ncbi:MAG: tRNA (adenosine(37)-N6)-threonylcarbamoyltransferase complex dimerization subunit type 1 TsaB [Patescibacteria group bacterium]|nr:tRNA (adenosine(37)-N6)-threonylcarbamoyltransferase complex dimerization subunit type 1 TsaB [Patescibacteria group bacterium]
MILDINTTRREKIYLILYKEKSQKCFEFETQDQSADLLVVIEKILKQQKTLLKNLKAIMINIGPGSFTGVRVGVTVANTLAWTLDIPIYGYKEGEQDKIFGEAIKNRQNKFSKSVIPYYQ